MHSGSGRPHRSSPHPESLSNPTGGKRKARGGVDAPGGLTRLHIWPAGFSLDQAWLQRGRDPTLVCPLPSSLDLCVGVGRPNSMALPSVSQRAEASSLALPLTSSAPRARPASSLKLDFVILQTGVGLKWHTCPRMT